MTRRVHYVRDVRRLAAYAVAMGAEARPMCVAWNIAGKCERPVNFSIEGRGSDDIFERPDREERAKPRLAATGLRLFDNPPMWIDMAVKCRKCPTCLKARASEWSYRARSELQAASRSWFGTMTLRPEAHFITSCRAQVAAQERGWRWQEMSPSEQFLLRHNEISKEITKWLKRVRKESEARLRYCLVAEAHKSGLPHYHILVHERWLGGQVTERQLRRQWILGHSKFNIVEGSAVAWYVAKYLAKASEARVRASVRYGQSGL